MLGTKGCVVALVLPPHEGFGPGHTGAVGMIAHRLARAARDDGTPALDAIVIGAPQPEPLFPDTPFCAAPPARLGLSGARRYARGVARVLEDLGPGLIEVYNRADLALALAAHFPLVPVMLNLQNDPQSMRDARTPAERAALLGRLARVVANSTYTLGRLIDGVASGAARAPPEVIYNALDPAELPPPAAERERLILFAGRVVAVKGADTFVRACARVLPMLPGWKAEMIGGDRFGPDSPETDFIRALRPLAKAASVEMLGYQPHAAVLAAMARAAIVVVPSRFPEPFGLVALEAMTLGAALITARRGGLPEVGGEAALYADPDDAASVAAVISELASDSERRIAVAAACQERARSFDIGPMAARLNALRRKAIAGEGC